MKKLEIQNLFFSYENKWNLENIHFSVEAGEFIGLLGPNGSGKSTLIRVIDGILKPQKGEVILDGVSVTRFSRPQIARRIGVVPQNGSTQFAFSAFEVVMMGRNPFIGNRLFERKEDLRIVEEAMKETDCWQFAHKPLNQLSGGEKQRVLIARAIAQQPEILLLDEPNAHMDISHQVECFDLLKQLNRKKKITILAVSHELNLASDYSQRLIVLAEGKVVQDGPPGQVLNEKNIKEIFKCETIVDRNPIHGAPRITLVTHKIRE